MEHDWARNPGDSAAAVDVAVIGGGLSGLVTAALLARGAGARGTVSVRLFEKATTLGGRAATQRDAGVRFNLGPHALYMAGPARRILRGLGIEPQGAVPRIGGSFALHRGKLEVLPGGLFSLLTTGLFGLSAKLEVGRLLGRLVRDDGFDLEMLAGIPLGDWIDEHLRDPTARQFGRALFRVSTYAHADAQQSAGAAIAQLRLANAAGVMYVDGGWGTMVEAAAATARGGGVEVQLGAKVIGVERDRRAHAARPAHVVRLADGTLVRAGHVVVAGTPRVASALFAESSSLARHAEHASPVRAACLDVALTRLPRSPGGTGWFALGIDAPLYASVHTRWARLVDEDGPREGAVVHLAKYLAPGDDGQGAEAELLAALELLQPGATKLVHARRFLPHMTVSGALVEASRGGLAGRPGENVPELPGAHVVGDWVGGRGMLLDAALASAEAAAETILRDLDRERARAAA